MMLHVDKAFFGVDGISIQGGFMIDDVRTVKINEIVMENSEKAFVLADSSKFGKYSFVSFAELKEIDTVFTDSGLGDEGLGMYRAGGACIEVVR